MTEYIDYLNEGQDVTVTTNESILSGQIIHINEEEGVFVFEMGGEDFEVRHVGGDLFSDDDTGEWPEYEIEIENGEWVATQDIRHGSFSSGKNPNLEADDHGSNNRF